MFPGHQSFLAGTVKQSLDLLNEYVFQGHMICFMFRDHHSFIAGTVKITRSSAQICLSRSLDLQHWYVFKSPDLLHGFVFQDHTICCMFPYHQSFIAGKVKITRSAAQICVLRSHDLLCVSGSPELPR